MIGPHYSRRDLLKGGASLAAASVAAPAYLRAAGAPIKIGVLQPLTGALAFDGAQGKLGADSRIKPINDAGGIKSLGGAKLEMVVGDARSTPDGGAQEVERMASEGRRAPSSAASRARSVWPPRRPPRATIFPISSTSACPIRSSSRGLTNTFRFAPGFGMVGETGDRQSHQAQRRRRQAGQDHRARA